MSLTRRSDNGDWGTTETLTADARCRATRPLADQEALGLVVTFSLSCEQWVVRDGMPLDATTIGR
jgi:hypothetical protein